MKIPELPYDPKLREAAKEFQVICKKYDCAGFVLFVSPTHCEFVNELSPTWSVVSVVDQTMLRFRSKREDFPTKEAQYFATEASAHMLTSVIEWSRRTNESMRSVLQQLEKHMSIVWKTWGNPDSTP